MELSILDQSPIISGHGAAQTIEETLKLERRADELGFHRYWLAEILRMLEALYPGRIDLGIGRAPGGDQSAAPGWWTAGVSTFSADELMVLTITGDYATRLESHERLAKAFALSPSKN